MPWLPDDSMACDTCGQVCLGDRGKPRVAIQRAMAKGWSYGAGKTLGGEPYEAMLCRGCRTGERKRTRIKHDPIDNMSLWGESA